MSRRWGCWPWVEPLLRMIELIVDECCAGGRWAGLRPGCRLDPQCGKHSGGGRGERLHRCLGIGGPWALASLLWPRWSPISGGSCLLSRHCGREGGWDGGLCGQQPAHGNLLQLFPGGSRALSPAQTPETGRDTGRTVSPTQPGARRSLPRNTHTHARSRKRQAHAPRLHAGPAHVRMQEAGHTQRHDAVCAGAEARTLRAK